MTLNSFIQQQQQQLSNEKDLILKFNEDYNCLRIPSSPEYYHPLKELTNGRNILLLFPTQYCNYDSIREKRVYKHYGLIRIEDFITIRETKVNSSFSNSSNTTNGSCNEVDLLNQLNSNNLLMNEYDLFISSEKSKDFLYLGLVKDSNNRNDDSVTVSTVQLFSTRSSSSSFKFTKKIYSLNGDRFQFTLQNDLLTRIRIKDIPSCNSSSSSSWSDLEYLIVLNKIRLKQKTITTDLPFNTSAQSVEGISCDPVKQLLHSTKDTKKNKKDVCCLLFSVVQMAVSLEDLYSFLYYFFHTILLLHSSSTSSSSSVESELLYLERDNNTELAQLIRQCLKLNYYVDYNEYQESIKRIQEQIQELLEDEDRMVELLVEIGLYTVKKDLIMTKGSSRGSSSSSSRRFNAFMECESKSECIFRLLLLLQRVVQLKEYVSNEIKEFIGGVVVVGEEEDVMVDLVEEYSLAYWSERMLDGEFMDYNEEYLIEIDCNDLSSKLKKMLQDELLLQCQPDYEYSQNMIRSRREGYCVEITRDTFFK